MKCIQRSTPFAAAALALTAAVSTAWANPITQTVNGNWNNAIWGTPAAPPTAGNTYVNANTFSGGGTPSITAPLGETFAGDALLLTSKRAFFVSGTITSTITAITANIQLGQGQINRNANGLAGLLGTLDIVNTATATDAGYIGATGNDGVRGFNIDASISGASNTVLNIFSSDSAGNASSVAANGGRDTVRVRNAGNTFAGTFRTVGRVDFVTTVNGSLGSAKIVLGDLSAFETNYAIDSGLNTLESLAGSTFRLGAFTHAFSSLKIGSYVVPARPEAYSVSELNAFGVEHGGGAFTGTGSILIPEPASAALAALGAVLVTARRRDGR